MPADRADQRTTRSSPSILKLGDNDNSGRRGSWWIASDVDGSHTAHLRADRPRRGVTRRIARRWSGAGSGRHRRQYAAHQLEVSRDRVVRHRPCCSTARSDIGAMREGRFLWQRAHFGGVRSRLPRARYGGIMPRLGAVASPMAAARARYLCCQQCRRRRRIRAADLSRSGRSSVAPRGLQASTRPAK